MKKTIKIIIIVIIIFFFSLYFSRYTNHYYRNNTTLTEEAIKKYEKDLKEGKKINSNNYKELEKNYNNNITKIGIKTSQIIEKTFTTSIKFMIKYLEKIENSWLNKSFVFL